MTSQNSQPTSLDSLTLEQLQDEIRQEMSEILKKSNLNKILENCGISGEKSLKIECSIHLNSNELGERNYSLAVSDRPILSFNCLCENGRSCQCN